MKLLMLLTMAITVSAFQNCNSTGFETSLGADNSQASSEGASSLTTDSEAPEDPADQEPSGPLDSVDSSPAEPSTIISCQAFYELNAQTGVCESCASKNLTYSSSQRKCVATCEGGFIVRLRQTDATSMEKVMNPMGYNIITGFSFMHNGVRIAVGDSANPAGSIPSSQFYNDLNAVVVNKSAEQGIANAFHDAIKLANYSLNGTTQLGDNYTTYETVNQQMVMTNNREIVYSAEGTFDVKVAAWRVYGGTPSSHAFMTKVYCK